MLLEQPLTSALGVNDPFVEASATALLKVKPARCSIKASCHGVRREAQLVQGELRLCSGQQCQEEEGLWHSGRGNSSQCKDKV